MKTSEAVKGHLVRYGTAADQHYLIDDFLDTYDQVVFNASIVAHMPAALAMFITQRAKNKPYFIDPQTHAFQHNIEYLQSNSDDNEGKIKRTFLKLSEQYGDPIRKKIQNINSILPSDFNDHSLTKDFCQRVLEHQINVISNEAKQSDVAPYYEFLKREGISINTFEPSLIVAPYFFMGSGAFKEWIETNKSCALVSRTIASSLKKPLGVQIAVSQDVLFVDTFVTEIGRYCDIKPDFILLWIDNFDEQTASVEHLKKYIELLNIFKIKNIPVVNLYGGFFSILLKRIGLLASVTHSIEYGEQRSIIPVGGGIPVAKFYLPSLHYRMHFRDALRAVRGLGGLKNVQDFYNNVCNCSQCKTVIVHDPDISFYQYGQTKDINNKKYPTPETKKNCVRHYMFVKEKEYNSHETLEEVLIRLTDTKKQIEKNAEGLGLENTIHCKNWVDAINSIKNRG